VPIVRLTARPALGRALAILVLIVAAIVGAVLRGGRIADKPLWLDEAYSAYAAAGGFDFLWRVVPTYEVHPPFYYSLLRLWSLVFGDSVLGLRSLGLACGLVLLPVAVLIARRLAGLLALDRGQRRWLVVAFGVLVAVSPTLIFMTREVRTYPVMILVYALGLLAILRLGAEAREGRLSYGSLAGFFVAQAAMLWLHNLGPFYGMAMTMALAALVVGRPLQRGDWIALVLGHLLVAVAYLPALSIALDQAPTWIDSTWLTFRPSVLQRRLTGLYATPWWPAWSIAAGALVLALVQLAWRGGEGRRVGIALVLMATLPVIISIAISLAVTPIFIPRIVSATVVPMLALMALPVALSRGYWRWGVIALLAVLVSDMGQLGWRVMRAGSRQDWNRAVAWLATRVQPGDIVLSYPNEGALPFDRAARDIGLAIRDRPIPMAVPALEIPGGWHPTGSRGVISLPPAQLRAIARDPALRAVPTVWLLRLGANAYDLKDVFLGELVGTGRTQAYFYRQGPIDLRGLRLKGVPPPRKAPTIRSTR
jgi:mannosyltransferase